MLKKVPFSHHASLLIAFICVSAAGQAAEIGMLYALEEDWKSFTIKAGVNPLVRNSGQRGISVLTLGPHRVRAVKMGAGPVETAVSTTALLAGGRCDWVISLGPCGSLAPDLPPGTVVLATQVTAWQSSQSKPLALPLPAPIQPLLIPTGEKSLFSFENAASPVSWRGVSCASGERFVELSEDRSAAAASGQIVEMNLSGAVGALTNYAVPGLHLRIVSDRADSNARGDFSAFLKTYQGDLGKLAYELIRQSKPDPSSPKSYETLRELIQQGAEPIKK